MTPTESIETFYLRTLHKAGLTLTRHPVKVRRFHKRPHYWSGTTDRGKVWLNVGDQVTSPEWKTLVCHEVAHAATPREKRHHGPEWARVFRELVHNYTGEHLLAPWDRPNILNAQAIRAFRNVGLVGGQE